MLLTILKSKIHMATVTSCELYYQGSIAVDPKLLKAAGFYPHEKVAVLNFYNGQRFETYVIEGKTGEVGLRGPAARLGKKGDRVIILSYALMTPKEAKKFKPNIIRLDDRNKIKSGKKT
jgi:aspartate 1-decarboxylase